MKNNKSFIVGLFVSVAFAGMVFLTMTTFVKSEFFNEWIKVYATFDDSFGLKSGNSVAMRGQKVGYIENIYLKKDHVLVEMNINRKYQDIISQNCVAELLQKNFVVGDWWISLKQTSTNGAMIAMNDTLSSNLPIHINKTVAKATKMVETIESIFQHIIGGNGTLGHLYVSDSLVGIAHSIGNKTDKLLNRSYSLISNTNNTLKKADTLFTSLTQTSESGKIAVDSLVVLSASLNQSIKSANILIKELHSTPEDLTALLQNLDSVVLEMDTVFNALERHWLLRGTIEDMKEEGKKKNE